MISTNEYARMALEAYYDVPETFQVDGTSYVAGTSSTAIGMDLHNSGFFATSFQSGNDIVIAFRGSNSPGSDLADWLSNAGWSTYTQDPPLQLLDAWNYYQLVKAENPTATISFTGHSLGGGLAGAMAALVGAEAEVFAPAPFEGTVNQLIESGGHTYRYVTGGPNNGELVILGSIPAPVAGAVEANVTSHIIEGEVLSTSAFGLFGAGSVIGDENYWTSGETLDSEFATTSYPSFSQNLAMHSMGLHAFASYADHVLGGVSGFNQLDANSPRMILQLVNDAIAENVWEGEEQDRLRNGESEPKTSAYFLEMLVQNEVVAADFLSDLATLGSLASSGVDAVSDPEINTAILQFVIEYASRRVEEEGALSNPLLSLEGDHLRVGLRAEDIDTVLGDVDQLSDYLAGGLLNQFLLEEVNKGGGVHNTHNLDVISVSDAINTLIFPATESGPLNYSSSLGDANELVFGGDDGDTISAGAGDDFLLGRGGDDFFEAGEGNNIVDGGEEEEFDTISYEAATSGIKVTVSNELSFVTIENGFGGTDLVRRVEKLIGSDYVDEIKLASGGEIVYIDSGAGDDRIDAGQQQNLIIEMGAGNDTIWNTGFGTVVHTGEGADVVELGTELYITDASTEDSLVLGNYTLRGAFAYSTSERGTLTDRKGWAEYGINGEQDLVIETMWGGRTFVANFDQTAQAGGNLGRRPRCKIDHLVGG